MFAWIALYTGQLCEWLLLAELRPSRKAVYKCGPRSTAYGSRPSRARVSVRNPPSAP